MGEPQGCAQKCDVIPIVEVCAIDARKDHFIAAKRRARHFIHPLVSRIVGLEQRRAPDDCEVLRREDTMKSLSLRLR